jgi:hypothetical protein
VEAGTVDASTDVDDALPPGEVDASGASHTARLATATPTSNPMWSLGRPNIRPSRDSSDGTQWSRGCSSSPLRDLVDELIVDATEV